MLKYMHGALINDFFFADALFALLSLVSVHEHNVETTLAAFMPYHETREFARILQIVRLENRSHFAFLVPVQKHGGSMPASVLISALVGSPSTTPSLATLRWAVSLLSSTKEHVRVARPRHNLQSFWLATIVRVCAYWSGDADEMERMGLSKSSGKKRDTRDDDAQLLLSVLLPAAVNLTSSETSTADERVLGCMALSSIAQAFDLSEEATRSLLATLASVRAYASRVHVAVFAACATLCARQGVVGDVNGLQGSSAELIPAAVARRFASKIAKPDAACKKTSQLCSMEAFFAHLSIGLAEAISQPGESTEAATGADSNLAEALTSILELEQTPKIYMASQIICAILQQAPLALSIDITETLAAVRQRRPDVFEHAAKAATSARSPEKKKAIEQKLWSIITHTSGQAKNSAANTDALWMRTQDNSLSSRKLALKRIFESVSKRELSAEDSLVQQTLSDALRDDDHALLATAYTSPAVLIQSLGLRQVVNLAVTALHTSDASSDTNARLSDEASHQHVKFLIHHAVDDKHLDETAKEKVWRAVVWPRLLCTKTERKSIVMLCEAFTSAGSSSIGGSGPTARKIHMLATAVATSVQEEDWEQVNARVIETVSAFVAEINESSRFEAECSFLADQATPGPHQSPKKSTSCLLAIFVLASMLSKSSEAQKADLSTKVLQILRKTPIPHRLPNDGARIRADLLPKSLLHAAFSKSVSEATLSSAWYYLYNSLMSVVPLEACATLAPADGAASAREAFACAVRITAIDQEAGTGLASTLLRRLGDGALSFLASIWTDDSTSGLPETDVDLKRAALIFGHAFVVAFQPSSQRAKVRQIDFQTILPSLLVALKSHQKEIRVEALRCVRAIQAVTKGIEGEQTHGQSVQIYGFDTIYGTPLSENLRYLDTSTATRMLEEFVDAGDAFLNDPFYCNTWLSARTCVLKGDGKRESAYKTSLSQFLLSHVVCWKNYSARIALLEALDGTHIASKLVALLPLIRGCFGQGSHVPSEEYVRLLFNAYDKGARKALQSNDRGCFTLLQEALECSAAVVQKHAALVLRSRVFAVLDSSKQREVLSRLADLIANSSTALPTELRRALPALEAEPEVTASVLADLRRAIMIQVLAGPPAKRGKIDGSIDHEAWIKASAIIAELLEASIARKPKANGTLTSEMFEILRLGTEMLFTRLGPAEQLMQLSMSNIVAILDAAAVESGTTVLEALRVDVVVNVIKTPCRPQTFHQALLLLSSVGKLAPESVLHHSMPIFTFVGNSMLQRDDEYSFTVIERTLQSILPSVGADLRNKNRKQSGSRFELLQQSSSLLCVFTDAATHIPRHRRGAFFQLLIQAIGPQDFLAAVCMLLVDRQALKIARMQGIQDVESSLQLPLLLFNRYGTEIDTQLVALDDVWSEIERTWQHHTEDPIEMQNHVFLDCVRGIGSEHDSGKVDPIKRILGLIHFATLVTSANREVIEDERSDETDAQRKHRDAILKCIIQRALSLSQVSDRSVADATQGALDETMTMVPVSTLEHIVLSLTNSKTMESRLTGLQIFSKSVQGMLPGERQKASSFTPQVIATCYDILGSKSANAPDNVLLALRSLASISSQCVSGEHAALSQGIPKILHLSRSKDDKVASFALSVLLALCEHLGPRLIPKIAEVVSLCRYNAESYPAVHARTSASLDILSAIVKSIPTFMSAHLSSLFELHVTHPTLAKLVSSRRLVSAVVSSIHPGEVLQATFAFHENAKSKTAALSTFALDIVQRCLKVLDRKKTLSQFKGIFRFILHVMDTRRLNTSEPSSGVGLSIDDINAVESEAVDTFMRLVLKLNESTFRPLFLRLCDWAMLDLVDEEDGSPTGPSEGNLSEIRARQVVLYKVLNALFKQLGELVVHYYANVLDGTIETLQQLAADQVAEDSLWSPLLESIKGCARIDRGAFWNQGRVKKILPALAQQLRTPLVHRSTVAEQAIGEAMSRLCQTVVDESCLKEANYQLLDLARDTGSGSSDGGFSLPANLQSQATAPTSMQTRVSAIRTMERVWRTKGCDDALLGLVPETVPSIAELLQESDEGIQHAMSGLVAAIEAILGEGLDAYLQ